MNLFLPRLTRVPGVLIPGIVIALALGSPSDEIDYASTIAAGLASAKTQQRLVVLVVTAECARGSHQLASNALQDKHVVALSKRTINVRFDLDEASSACHAWVGEHLLQKSEKRVLKAPQLVFLNPDGSILSSCAGRMAPGQVEWAWLEALAGRESGDAAVASEVARPPTATLTRQVHSQSKNVAPLSRVEIRKFEAQLAKDENQYPVLARHVAASRSLAVIKKYESVCAWYQAKGWMGMLKHIQRKSGPRWARVVKMALRNPDGDVRLLAAQTAEAIAAEESLPMLLKVFKKEKRADIRKAQLLALVASAPADRKVVGAVYKALRDRKSAGYRTTATRLLAQLPSLKAVEKGLTKALADKDPGVRKAAAEVIKTRRNKALVPVGERALKKEKDDDVREALQDAIEVAAKGLR